MPIKHALIAFLGILAFGCATVVPGQTSDFNSRVLAAIGTMPSGGAYDGSDATKNLLHGACSLSAGKIRVNANRAKPSFCSGATYLVLLKALGRARKSCSRKSIRKTVTASSAAGTPTAPVPRSSSPISVPGKTSPRGRKRCPVTFSKSGGPTGSVVTSAATSSFTWGTTREACASGPAINPAATARNQSPAAIADVSCSPVSTDRRNSPMRKNSPPPIHG